MGRIKTNGGKISKGSDHSIAIGRADSVTTVLYQPEIILFCECCYGCNVERIPQCMSNHDGTCTLGEGDRKSTRLNSSHLVISYAVFCLRRKRHQRTSRGSGG